MTQPTRRVVLLAPPSDFCWILGTVLYFWNWMQWHWNFCIFVTKTQKYLIIRVKHLEVRVSYTSTTNTNLPGPELVTQLLMKVVCCQKWMRWKMSKALLCKLLCGHCHARGHGGGRVQKVRKNWRRRWWMAPLKNNFPTHSGYTRHYTGGPADIGSQLLSLPYYSQSNIQLSS